MTLNNIEIFILKELFQSSKSKLYAFTIFKKANVHISEFNKSMSSLVSKGMIQDNDDLVLSLTVSGKDWLLSNENKKVSVNKEWLEIPSSFKTDTKIELNSFYIPNADLLSD